MQNLFCRRASGPSVLYTAKAAAAAVVFPMPAIRLPSVHPVARLPGGPARRFCRCALEARPARAWAVFKESAGRGVRSAWLHGGSASFVVECARGGEKGDSPEEVVEEGDKVGAVDSATAQGRQRLGGRRSRSSAGSMAVPLSGNPDLLTIPGVGPRNLRKLVDKGIGGVAELKQLYRDKVNGIVLWMLELWVYLYAHFCRNGIFCLVD